MRRNLDLSVRITELDFVKELMQLFRDMLKDPEIPLEIRDRYSAEVARIIPEQPPPMHH